MSDTEKLDPALEGVELDDDVEVFDVGMFDSGATGSGFHTKNDPKRPFQRSKVIERTGAIDIRCALVDVVHGLYAEDSEYYATLMVLQFRFDPQKKARRITQATIELKFDVNPKEPDNEMPVVVAISFDGNYSLMPSKQTESITKGGDGSIGASYGADFNASAKWEKTVNRETTDATTVNGGKLVVNNVGEDRIAKWTLLENKTLKTGVPASIRVAVLIKRLDEKEFACIPKLECKADKWTSIESFFGKVPEDDPIRMDPAQPPTNKLMKYNPNELSGVNLQALSDVTFTTMITDAIKNQEKLN